MEDLPFLKIVTILLPTVVGMVLLAASARSHSTFDGGLGVFLIVGAACLFCGWFARR
jgi:predicted benzoate:H+ symporter BenE